jgi:hypothetical protein
VHLMALSGKFDAQLSGHNARSTVSGITSNSDPHKFFQGTQKIAKKHSKFSQAASSTQLRFRPQPYHFTA